MKTKFQSQWMIKKTSITIITPSLIFSFENYSYQKVFSIGLDFFIVSFIIELTF